MIKYYLILITMLVLIGFSFGIGGNGENNQYYEIKKKVDDLIKFKNESEILLLKLSAISAGFILIISIFGGKQLINIKKSLESAKKKINNIDYIEKISLFKFMLDDYYNIMRREAIATNYEFGWLQLKAKKIIYNYEKLESENIFEKYTLTSYYISIIADAYFEVGNIEKSKELFDKAYVLDSENSRANYGIAFSLEMIAENKNDPSLYIKERINHLLLAVKIEPVNVGYITDLGFTYIVANNYKNATYCFKKAYNIDKLKFFNYFKRYSKDDNNYFIKYFKTNSGKEILSLIDNMEIEINLDKINRGI